MKRDPRLQGLTSDHHQGLVLARRLAQGRVGAAEARRRFDADLAPHFRVEEELLLPALAAAGAGDLAERTLLDHAEIREHLAAAERGDAARLAALGAKLEAHIRFEERELFPAAESRLGAEDLERVRERAPHDARR